MFDHFLPKRIDNSYSGHQAALWIFVPLLLLKVVMSINGMFNGYIIAMTADGIPLNTFPPASVHAVVAFVAMWGLGHFLLCVLSVLVFVRYRAMIPFMFALLLLEHLGRELIWHLLPVERIGTPPAFYVNFVFLALMAAGLPLSLRQRSPQNVHSLSDAKGTAQ